MKITIVPIKFLHAHSTLLPFGCHLRFGKSDVIAAKPKQLWRQPLQFWCPEIGVTKSANWHRVSTNHSQTDSTQCLESFAAHPLLSLKLRRAQFHHISPALVDMMIFDAHKNRLYQPIRTFFSVAQFLSKTFAVCTVLLNRGQDGIVKAWKRAHSRK